MVRHLNGRSLVSAVSLFAASALSGQSTASPIEFMGIAMEGKTTTAWLSDPSTRLSSWVGLGKTFEGYVVTSYDPNAKVLVLEKKGGSLSLRLKSGVVVPADAPEIEITGITPAPKSRPDLLQVTVTVANFTKKPLYYPAAECDGSPVLSDLVMTEIMEDGRWQSLFPLLAREGEFTTYELKPGATVQFTSRPFVAFPPDKELRETVFAGPVRFRVDLSGDDKLETTVAAHSRACSASELWLDTP